MGDTDLVKFTVLNDTTYQVNYPSRPVKIKNVIFDNYEGRSYVSYGNSGLKNCIDEKNNEMLFGPDRLKYKKIGKDVIEVRFPRKISWHFTRISEREMIISNGKYKLKFTEFID